MDISVKSGVSAGAGVVGAVLSFLFGEITPALTALFVVMAADYITGLLVAGVFKRSKKSESGALNSTACLMGLAKKGVCLLIILVAHHLDNAAGTTFIRDGVIIAFIANEVISLGENAGLMGVPFPAGLTKAIDILNSKNKEEGK
jgi:toxin secretion/phage lysis holin